MTKKPMTEKPLMLACNRLLKMHGWFVVRNQESINRSHHMGISDVTVLKAGRVVWVEYKTERKGSKQSTHQVQFERDIQIHGGEYAVIRSIEECVEYFDLPVAL